MGRNRLGTLFAALLGVGWLVALAITFGIWLPQQWGVDPMFYEQGEDVLAFVAEQRVAWQIFHVGASTGLLVLLPLIGMLGEELPRVGTWRGMQILGLLGAGCGLMASLIDQFATPVLARLGGNGGATAVLIWETVEPFRDGGLKSISFLLLGLWLAWWISHLPTEGSSIWLRRSSRWLGWGLIGLGLVEFLVPLPFKNVIGETGVLGVVLALLPVWAFLVANYFWAREVEVA